MEVVYLWALCCLFLGLVGQGVARGGGKQYNKLSELRSAIQRTNQIEFKLARFIEDDLEEGIVVEIDRDIVFQGHPGTTVWRTKGQRNRLVFQEDEVTETGVVSFFDIAFLGVEVEELGQQNPLSFPYVQCQFCEVQLKNCVLTFQQVGSGLGVGQLLTDIRSSCTDDRFNPKTIDHGLYFKAQYIDSQVCQVSGFDVNYVQLNETFLIDITPGRSRYLGGQIVLSNKYFREALSNQKVRSIFVASDVDLRREDFTRSLLDRDLRIYGDGKELSTNYDNSQFLIGAEHVLTVENLKLTSLQVPVYHAFPSDPIFLALVEHNLASSGVRIRDCHMTSGMPSSLLNSTSSFHSIANRTEFIEKPIFINQTTSSFEIDYWNVSSSAWLAASLGQTDSKFDAYYEFSNVTYTQTKSSGDYCKQTSVIEVKVTTPEELRENLGDERVRAISLVKSIVLDDDWWRSSDKLVISRPVELVNCDQRPKGKAVVLDLNSLKDKIVIEGDGYLMLRGKITLQNAPGDPLYGGNVLLPGFFQLKDSARVYFKETVIRAHTNLSQLSNEDRIAQGLWPRQANVTVADFGARIGIQSWYVDVAEAQSMFNNRQSGFQAVWVFSDVWLEVYRPDVPLPTVKSDDDTKDADAPSGSKITDEGKAGETPPGKGVGLGRGGRGGGNTTPEGDGTGGQKLAVLLGLVIGLSMGVCLLVSFIIYHRRRHPQPAKVLSTTFSPETDHTNVSISKGGSYGNARSSSVPETGGKSEVLADAGLSKNLSLNTDQGGIPVPVPAHSADSVQVQEPQESVSDATSLAEETHKLGTMLAKSVGTLNSSDMTDIQLGSIIGIGSFGRVYKGTWRGIQVAVKVLQVPGSTDPAPQLRTMAVVESAVAASLHHPNIVQCYKQLRRPADTLGTIRRTSSSNSGSSLNVDMRNDRQLLFLVLEFCDRGNIRDAVLERAFKDSAGRLLYTHVCLTLLDVARAMQHLHASAIIHGDLKARNVLLKSESLDPRGFAAKVADFGLATCLDPGQTHVSAVQNGTMTHMAPELLLHGKVSYASDVYAFGIMMWEVFTGGNAYFGVPRALLGHQVAMQNLRPSFPKGTPALYAALAKRCWHADSAERPSFDTVSAELHNLLRDIVPGSGTPAGLAGAREQHRSVESDDAVLERRGGGTHGDK